MKIAANVAVSNTYQFDIAETCESIFLALQSKHSAAVEHNMQYGQSCYVSIAIHNRRGNQLDIAVNVPLINLLRVSQWKAGFFKIIKDTVGANNDYLPLSGNGEVGRFGLAGKIKIGFGGAIELSSDQYIRVTITSIPDDSIIWVNSCEDSVITNTAMKYEVKAVRNREENVPVKDYDLLLVPGGSIDIPYQSGENNASDYPNPLSHILIEFPNGKANRSWDKTDMIFDNDFENIDVASITVPNWHIRTVHQGFTESKILFGAHDWNVVEIGDADSVKFYKVNDNILPFLAVRRFMI